MNTEAITTLLRERVATLARALREAGSTTLGEWCGMPHRQEVRAIGENRSAFVTYPLDVLMLRSHALNTPGTVIVQEYRPNHLTHDAEGNEEPVSYASGEPPSPGLGNVFSADGAPTDWTVFARMPVSAGARLVNTITCAELAAMVERDAERLVSSTADEIDRTARFYVEPHLLGAALSSERLRSIVWPWPFSLHVGDGPNVCEPAAISHAAIWFSAKPRDAEGLGLNHDVGEPEAGSWMQDVQRWHIQSPRFTVLRERGEAAHVLPGMVGTWALELAPPALDASRLEESQRDLAHYVRGCSHVGIGLLYVARREALAELEASRDAAARFALELVRGLGSDAAWYHSIRRRVAIDALERAGADKSDAAAIEALAESLRVTMSDLADALPSPDDAHALEEGIPRWDARTATFAESLGADGIKWAAAVRSKGTERAQSGKLWELWADPSYSPPGCRAARGLARVLWRERVGPQLDRDRRKRERSPIGSPLPVARFLSEVMQRGTVVKRDEERQIDWLLDRDENPIAELESGTLVTGISRAALTELQKEAELLGSVEAHALRHYLLRQAREHHVNGGDFVIEIVGGLEGLAREIGSTSKESPARLHRVLDALRRLRRDYHGILLAGFVTYVLDMARGQRASVLRIIIGDPLRPTFVHFLQNRLGATAPIAQEARMIVPDVGAPPLYGRANDWALQETAALETSILFRQRADELAERGAVHVARVEWERIAHRSGYARRYLGRTVDELLKHWVRDGEKNNAPAFLEHSNDWRFNFGPAHTEARASLLEAGQRTLKGRKDGEASSKRRVGGPKRTPSARRRK